MWSKSEHQIHQTKGKVQFTQVWGVPATGGSWAGPAVCMWQEAPWGRLWKFLLLSEPRLHVLTPSQFWMGLGFLGTWVIPPTTSWSPPGFWPLQGSLAQRDPVTPLGPQSKPSRRGQLQGWGPG